jgi:uncharacterized linocin/CFP29 family protein
MTVATARIDEFVDRGNQITEAVAATARVCAQFLPKYELQPNTKSVTLTSVDRVTLNLDDVTTVPLTEIRVKFSLDWQQLSAADLGMPLYLVRKHAQAYCRLEDRLLLAGQAARPQDPQLPLGGVQVGAAVLPPIQPVKGVPGGEVERGHENPGLHRTDLRVAGRNIYNGIAKHHALLESQAVFGPWALVMGASLFDQSDRTTSDFVDSPRERIENLLGTRIHRTSILGDWTAILMGGASTPQDIARSSGEPMAPVDRAVALEPQLRFLRTDNDGRYEFAIVGSLALRVKDQDCILQIEFDKQ